MLFAPQPCFSEQKKTSNLEAYVKWFNRLCYLVATEICMVRGIDAACFTAARGTALRWHINKETWGFISYDLAKRLTVSFSSAAFTETT